MINNKKLFICKYQAIYNHYNYKLTCLALLNYFFINPIFSSCSALFQAKLKRFKKLRINRKASTAFVLLINNCKPLHYQNNKLLYNKTQINIQIEIIV